jgi:acyl-CoA thioesterase
MSEHDTTDSIEQVLSRSECGEAGITLRVDDAWLQGRSWYGGLQMALAVKAARRQVGDAIPLRSMHAVFLAPVSADAPATARAEILRAGKSVTHVRAWLEQGGRRCFEVLALLGHSRHSRVEHDSNLEFPVAPEDARLMPYVPGRTPNCIRHYQVRWAKGQPPFTGAEDPGAVIYARTAADRPYSESEFLGLTDVIPTPLISLRTQPGPASSMNCALELIRPEVVYGRRCWLRFDSELHDAHSGYAWQSAHIYDEVGTLLAISHQSVAVFG